jgi:hypothetical protein
MDSVNVDTVKAFEGAEKTPPNEGLRVVGGEEF